MAGSTIGVVQVVLSARDDSLAREFRKATKQIESFKGAAETAFKVVMGTEMTRKAINGMGQLVDYMTLTTAEAKKLGLVLSEDTRQRLTIAEDAFTQMGRSINGIRLVIADGAAPSLTAFARLIADATNTSENMRSTVSDLDHAIENVSVVIISLAQGISGLFLLIAVPIQAVAVAVSGLMESLIEVGYWIDGIGNSAEQSFRATKNTAAGLESSIEALQGVFSGSWSDKFRAEMSNVRSEIAQTAKVGTTAVEQLAAERASEERQRLAEVNRAKYFAQLDQDLDIAAAKEARRIADGTQKYALAAEEREAIWRKEQLDRKIALDLDPKARAEFVGNAASDPRVKYELDVMAAIKDGKAMAEAVELAKQSESRDYAVHMPGDDVRVLYESEVQRLINETQRQAAMVQRQNEMNRQQAYLQTTAQFFGDIQTITEDGAKKNAGAFLVNRAAAMAQAEIMAWLAYANILGQSTMYGGPLALPFAQAMATTALVAGHVAVASIASQTIQGSRANGGGVSRGGLYQVNERGPEMLTIGDKSFLMMGNRDGSVTPNSGRGGAAGVTVNIHNAPGTTATVQQGGTPEAPRLDIIIERVDQAIASGIRSGSGSTARAIQSTYGVNRARGAT
jgi:hypothetical protein